MRKFEIFKEVLFWICYLCGFVGVFLNFVACGMISGSGTMQQIITTEAISLVLGGIFLTAIFVKRHYQE